MKYIDEYRNKDIVQYFAGQINIISTKHVRIMEVCGGHTVSIQKFGLPYLLPKTVELISGPGCPVCVTSREYIDRAVAYSRMEDVIITTYGDLIRVPGSTSTLEKEKASGADVRIVYSILDAMLIAKNNGLKKVIFLGIGFETTAPASAAGILKARTAGLKNFYVYSAHKVMPPAMEALIDDGVNIDGYIGPGHVSTITGQSIYMDIPKKYKMGVVISGFEPVDIMQSIHMLVQQIENNEPKVEIQYTRVVKPEGNVVAQQMLDEIFEYRADWWRGLGILKNSGLKIKKEYEMHDSEKMIEVEVEETIEPKGCICGLILRGEKKPKDCGLFGKSCTPADPVGACMVSSEGSCHASYLYNR